jgi:hypothetical protein
MAEAVQATQVAVFSDHQPPFSIRKAVSHPRNEWKQKKHIPALKFCNAGM